MMEESESVLKAETSAGNFRLHAKQDKKVGTNTAVHWRWRHGAGAWVAAQKDGRCDVRSVLKLQGAFRDTYLFYKETVSEDVVGVVGLNVDIPTGLTLLSSMWLAGLFDGDLGLETMCSSRSSCLCYTHQSHLWTRHRM